MPEAKEGSQKPSSDPEKATPAADALDKTIEDSSEGQESEPASLAKGSQALSETLSNAETLLESDEDRLSSDSDGALLESGDSLGRLEIGEILGQGAFGVVVAAFDPQLKRKLAIKLLKPEVFESKSGRDAHKRLLREARAMAKISHANVVTVHDIGTVDAQVYIAMEFVEGGNLSQWLSEESRSWQEIVAVFLQAGRGLAAAHREGLVHRDFKPDNVLVNPKGEVRVADFGLVSISEKRGEALASGDLNLQRSSSSGDLNLTHAGSLMGTALFMSPEQHLGDEVTPASDQFSFCVALYTALYKRGPFPARNYKELRKAVIMGEVLAPPSTTSIPKWLHAVLRKGLSLEVEDRYSSMPQLLEALASDPSSRLRSRRRWTGGSIAVVLAIGLLLWSQRSETQVCQDAAASLAKIWDGPRKRDINAVFARERSSDYSRFEDTVTGYTSRWVSVRTQVCEATHLRGEQSEQLLDRRMGCLNQQLHYLESVLAQVAAGASGETIDSALKVSSSLKDPAGCVERAGTASRMPLPDDPAARDVIASANKVVDQAQAHMDLGAQARAVEILESLLQQDLDYAPTLARATSILGKSKVDLGQIDAGEQYLRQSIEEGTRAGDDGLVANSWLALMHLDGTLREDYARGYENGRMAGLAMVRGQAGPVALALLERSRASIMIFEGKSGEALKLLESILATVEKEGTESEISELRTTLGDAASAESKFEDALAHYKLALAHIESVLGPNHPENIYILNNMAVAMKGNGDIEGAGSALERSLSLTERSYGKSVRAVVPILINLGNIYRRGGDLDAAKATLQRAIVVGEATTEEGHPMVTKSMMNLGIVLASQEDYAGATEAFRTVLTRAEASFSEDHPDKAKALNNLGESLFLEKKYDESLPYTLLALEMKVRIHGDAHPRIASTVLSLGNLYLAMGEEGKAESHLERALAIFVDAAGEKHPRTILALSLLGRLHASTGAAGKAIHYLERAIAARGDGGSGLEQAQDRFDLLQVQYRTRGKKSARQAAVALLAELGSAKESSELAAELASWIDEH